MTDEYISEGEIKHCSKCDQDYLGEHECVYECTHEWRTYHATITYSALKCDKCGLERILT